MPFVQHPAFENVVQEVADDKVSDWTDAGWKRISKTNVDAAAEARAADELEPGKTHTPKK